ncbi:CDP-diacylglycerol--serine O-phosphatidyltransferase [Clostridium isatidis]|uniref:CDP-diacylglycerol--serine O-phosphatidyltransferase n=1 Tax=Clostridium isatidis TaxID=182773 RepID=A0A343JD10_9CLOT|nr:CDP-diacylglycerol--serine O-phosphatidyltransferase [Clostridium isatidis]ASW43418.1 CDP-diacylglycerol--serine O-phosphatidyltransferase [Clostridium isatidis]
MKRSFIPNIFTFTNLSCGIMSLINAFDRNYLFSCLFILFAGIVDRYDGRIARKLNVTSEIGKELDSLADLVSFGVAPSILMFIIYNFSDLGPLGIIGFTCLLLLPICGAYRLAKYNISNFDGVYTGVPITIVGCFMALFVLCTVNKNISEWIPTILIFIGSYLMVSKFKFKKL